MQPFGNLDANTPSEVPILGADSKTRVDNLSVADLDLRCSSIVKKRAARATARKLGSPPSCHASDLEAARSAR